MIWILNKMFSLLTVAFYTPICPYRYEWSAFVRIDMDKCGCSYRHEQIHEQIAVLFYLRSLVRPIYWIRDTRDQTGVCEEDDHRTIDR